MKHSLIILISLLLLSSPVIGNSHKGETLYGWNMSTDKWNPIFVWKGFGDKETHPIYKGDVKNGKPNGLGYLIDPDGGKYVGSWKDGKRSGQGTYTHSFGSKYIGSWKNDEKNGQGTITYPGGDKYVGGWKDGLMSGQGTYTIHNGTKYVGEYKDNNFWNGTGYDKNGNIIGKRVNGKQVEQ